MKAPNHIAGGILFTGLFSSLSGINIFDSHTTTTIMTVASLLPDIDHPQSAIGRLVKPLSTWLNRHYGHRTITHSALALLVSTLIFALIEKIITGLNTLSLIYFYAYLSHLILDMMTLQGVPLLYPFYKNPFVLPGNPSFRLRTGDVKAEAIIFCIFTLLGIWLKPLFNEGFWTNYNRFFGTLHHLHAEFERNENLLEVSYFAHHGSKKLQGKGYCVQATENSAVLLENGRFTVLNEELMTIDKVVPKRTNHQFYFDEYQFFHITIDSLNRWLANKTIATIDLVATKPFRIVMDQQSIEQRHFVTEFANHIWLEEVPEPLHLDTFIYEPLTRIATLEHQLRQLRQANQHKKQAWEDHLMRLNSLEAAVKRANSMVTQEQLYHRYAEALKAKPPVIDTQKEVNLQIELKQLKQLEYLKNKEKQWQVRQKNGQQIPKPTRINGTVVTIRIE